MFRRSSAVAGLALALTLGLGASTLAAPPPVVTDRVSTTGAPAVATDPVIFFHAPIRYLGINRVDPFVSTADLGVRTGGSVGTGTYVGVPGALTYVPAFQYQLVYNDPQGGYNCTAYSAAMAIDKSTYGGDRVNGAQIRDLSTAANWVGLTLPDVIGAANLTHVQLINESGLPWVNLMNYLVAGRGVILQGVYALIPYPYSGQLSFKGNHAVYVDHVSPDRLSMWVMDPLFKGGGHWVPTSIMRAFAEKLGRNMRVYPGVYFAITRVTRLFR